MKKHTPGPWIANDMGLKDGYFILSMSGCVIARVGGKLLSYQDAQSRNAQIMAAAPDMLDALKKAEAYLQGIKSGKRFEEGDLVAVIQQAIRKSGGWS